MKKKLYFLHIFKNAAWFFPRKNHSSFTTSKKQRRGYDVFFDPWERTNGFFLKKKDT
jgi:hypothetical protein